MDFWEVIKNRKSTRRFDQERAVSEEQVEKIIEAAKDAPSAGGIYETEFLVVRDKKAKERLAEAAHGQSHVAQAPVVLVVTADVGKIAARYEKRGENLYSIQDAAAATENLLLAATAVGLGACWVGAFDEEAISKILKLPVRLRPLAIVPVGYGK